MPTSKDKLPHDPLAPLVAGLLKSYRADDKTHHIDSTFLPSRDRAVAIVEALRRLIFPGFFDHQRLTWAGIEYHVGEQLAQLRELLYEQIRAALRYDANRTHKGKGDSCPDCDAKAGRLTAAFLEKLPERREILATDVKAFFEGDPAAVSTDETIFCYPGLDAIFTHRMAHELWRLEVPLLPRMMTEYAHRQTGIDIHPGAAIGESFFIDHGTGVVIGETTEIGKRVRIYQGVTLGALTTRMVEALRGRKRHPTIEDDVTIYGGAIILGGETVIGKGSTIGGSVFLTQSVPPGSTVSMKPPELRVSNRQARRGAAAGHSGTVELDFQI